jgi:hypothetical protein
MNQGIRWVSIKKIEVENLMQVYLPASLVINYNYSKRIASGHGERIITNNFLEKE